MRSFGWRRRRRRKSIPKRFLVKMILSCLAGRAREFRKRFWWSIRRAVFESPCFLPYVPKNPSPQSPKAVPGTTASFSSASSFSANTSLVIPNSLSHDRMAAGLCLRTGRNYNADDKDPSVCHYVCADRCSPCQHRTGFIGDITGLGNQHLVSGIAHGPEPHINGFRSPHGNQYFLDGMVCNALFSLQGGRTWKRLQK